MAARVLCVMGTRPEVIKMAPVVQALRGRGLDAPILATAQHRGMLDQMLGAFGLTPDWDLDAMREGQTLASLTGRLVPAIDAILRDSGASAVLAQGDTATVFCTALSAYYAGLPFGHVEAGLRSGDLSAPFPEEGMRRLAAVLARWHFAPTETARQALRREGHAGTGVHVVGNTVIDALLATAARRPPWPAEVPPLVDRERLVLVTLHRRESFGEPLRRILGALRTFAGRHPEARLVYPVHPNPAVRGPAREILSGLANVQLTEPLEYPEMVALLQRCQLVFTDSGGLQEEGPALGKPVLVFREVTERPEAVAAGAVCLVGTDPQTFLDEAERLWTDAESYRAMAQPRFPFGDGRAGDRIATVLAGDLA